MINISRLVFEQTIESRTSHTISSFRKHLFNDVSYSPYLEADDRQLSEDYKFLDIVRTVYHVVVYM
jgi:hypothetical protein